jgi:hypothetical protein
MAQHGFDVETRGLAGCCNVAVLLVALCCTGVEAQLPNHPVITEVFTDPAGISDGPVGRDPGNLHQEFIEIYLPPAAQLDLSLNKDALRLAFYEVEGDSSSSGNSLVNYRVDLPTFDLDSDNGITPGAIARPANGVVVMGWVDYVGNPPSELSGTPATRVAQVEGGVTSVSGYTFVAINGEQFSGTTNFPVPAAVSSIDMPNEASSGIIQNGSAAYLLVNRDDAGYVELYDDNQIPIGGSADPSLATGTVLQTSALLDGFAANDHGKFAVLDQPYAIPTGDDIDLETVLPFGGPFSRLIPQVDEVNEFGYRRLFVDVAKTTEDVSPANDDPVADALNAYRTVSNDGPFFPTPGSAPLTTVAAELSVAAAPVQQFDVLTGTTGRPGIVSANVGGNFALQTTANPGASSDPLVATASVGVMDTVVSGQSFVYPSIAVTVGAGVADGSTVTIPVTVSADKVNAGDPDIVNPIAPTTATIRAIDPLTGTDAAGLPFQATAFVAMHGLPDSQVPGVVNEFASTSLATFVAANLGGLVDDERHNGANLLNSQTDLSNSLIVDAMEDDMPDDPLLFINASSTAGTDDLVTTILNSAEVQAGHKTYEDNFNATQTAVRAVRFNIAETLTSGGTFVPTESVYYAGPTGIVGEPSSGLSNVTTTRGFELAILDSNVQQFGTLESGETDDFGIIVEVGRVRAGAQVLPGEFVFLSFTGGLEGADIDAVNVPPHNNQTVIIYGDLDPLDTVLGCETITQLYIVDGSGGSALNVIEVFSLNAQLGIPFDADRDGDVDLLDYAELGSCLNGPGVAAAVGCVALDGDADGDVDMDDYAAFARVFN